MNIPSAALLALLLLTACTSDKALRENKPMAAPTVAGAGVRTIEVDAKPYQVQWLEYEMDFDAMIKGERGSLTAEQDPWAKIPAPLGTVATIAGFVLVSQHGQMDNTGEIVSWENRDMELGGGSRNLSHRGTHAIPTWRLPFDYAFRRGEIFVGTRIRTSLKDRPASISKKVEVAPPPPFEAFVDGERYVFCLKHDSEGEITAWAGDVLAVIHIVPTYRIAAPNPVLAVTVDNLLGFRTVETGKSENKVVFELSKAGKEFSWRDNNRQGAFKASHQSVQMLTYALNMIAWEKLPEASEKDAPTRPWQYAVQYRDGDLTKSATLSPLVNGREIILESAELGCWKGENLGAIAVAFQAFGQSR